MCQYLILNAIFYCWLLMLNIWILCLCMSYLSIPEIMLTYQLCISPLRIVGINLLLSSLELLHPYVWEKLDLPFFLWGCPRELVVKNPPAHAGDIREVGSIPGLGRSHGKGHGNPLQYFCLQKAMDRGAWPTTVHRVTQSQTRLKRLNTAQYTSYNVPIGLKIIRAL